MPGQHYLKRLESVTLSICLRHSDMHIWVDADACPAVIKDILFRAAERSGFAMTLVANHPMRIPKSPRLSFLQVPAGFDVADNEILNRLQPKDLVITGDIPLANAVIEKQAQALNPRGELYTIDNIRSRLSMRDFMEQLRASGVETSGPAPLNARDRQNFANALDKILNRAMKQKNCAG